MGDNLQQQSSNFLLDCNQLPPSSDLPGECLPIVSMTLDKLESQVIAMNNPSSNLVHNEPNLEETCLVEGSRGVNYRGPQSITRNGLMCQKWNPQIMRSNYMNVASEEILSELSGHNYCRNIDNDPEGPWCYTTNPRVPKDFCNIQPCGSINNNNNNNDLVKTSPLDKSFMKESKLIIGAIVSFLCIIVFILMLFCFCRSRGNTTTGTASNHHLILHKNSEKQQSISSSVNGMPILSNLSGGTCASSVGASQIHPSRLRMSNVSLGNKKQQPSLNKNHRGGSSKSSVASSSTNNQQNNINMEVNNPFIGKSNYDNQQNIFNYQQQQQMQIHQVPQFQIQQIHHQIQLQHQFQQQQQQAPQITNDCDFSVKQFSANNLRLLSEIGKGNFTEFFYLYTEI